MMRIVLCFIFISANCEARGKFAAVISQYQDTIKEYRDICLEETDTKPNKLESLLNHGVYDKIDDNLKCCLRCLYLKLKIFDETGKISEETMRKTSGTENLEVQDMVVSKCQFRNANLCEQAFDISNCTYYTVKNVY
ncbi:hypothetical protein PPYR_02111 [Photinus pyralis]|uniref:Uncharacterized protein n=1 Tax=Photinus pyralis TaxID=7054 RepID=A0A1Y1NF29_PHOPY|nr:hypothetical protein PPYR_02016 [Photinus pyralis]KAB0805141.1 hypothetical protein PPYR_02111 [Photinus pyralis]